MKARALLCVGLGAALAGCGGLKSTLPAAPDVVPVAGAATAAVAPSGLDAELTRLQTALERRLMGRDWGVPLQLARGPEALVRVRLGADASFAPGSAQLQPQALRVYAEIGELLRASPGVVAHVLAHGDTPAGSEPWTDLTARRAASVMAYLVERGVPATRLRAEGRAASDPVTVEAQADAVNRRVEIVLRPVVLGQEAEAWMPPPRATGCQACSSDE